jgi:Short C-terminal domain
MTIEGLIVGVTLVAILVGVVGGIRGLTGRQIMLGILRSYSCPLASYTPLFVKPLGRQTEATPPQAPATVPIDGLERLRNLVERGAINQEEYETQKRKLLGS